MANENVIFKKGSSTSLPGEITPGALLVETDTGKMYLDILDFSAEVTLADADVIVDGISSDVSVGKTGEVILFQKRNFVEGKFPTSTSQVYYQSSIQQFLKVANFSPDEDAELVYLESAEISDTSPQKYSLTLPKRIDLSKKNIYYNVFVTDETVPLPGNKGYVAVSNFDPGTAPTSQGDSTLYFNNVTTDYGSFVGIFHGVLSSNSELVSLICLGYLDTHCFVESGVPSNETASTNGLFYYDSDTKLLYISASLDGGYTNSWVPLNSVDETYNPESENAQSGKAVAQALSSIVVDDGALK